MFNYLREKRYQQGQRDRKAGSLPRMQDSAYLEGYLQDRPEGFDAIIQYFSSIEEYMDWKQKI